jgi:hypothetical protein
MLNHDEYRSAVGQSHLNITRITTKLPGNMNNSFVVMSR